MGKRNRTVCLSQVLAISDVRIVPGKELQGNRIPLVQADLIEDGVSLQVQKFSCGTKGQRCWVTGPA